MERQPDTGRQFRLCLLGSAAIGAFWLVWFMVTGTLPEAQDQIFPTLPRFADLLIPWIWVPLLAALIPRLPTWRQVSGPHDGKRVSADRTIRLALLTGGSLLLSAMAVVTVYSSWTADVGSPTLLAWRAPIFMAAMFGYMLNWEHDGFGVSLTGRMRRTFLACAATAALAYGLPIALTAGLTVGLAGALGILTGCLLTLLLDLVMVLAWVAVTLPFRLYERWQERKEKTTPDPLD